MPARIWADYMRVATINSKDKTFNFPEVKLDPHEFDSQENITEEVSTKGDKSRNPLVKFKELFKDDEEKTEEKNIDKKSEDKQFENKKHEEDVKNFKKQIQEVEKIQEPTSVYNDIPVLNNHVSAPANPRTNTLDAEPLSIPILKTVIPPAQKENIQE